MSRALVATIVATVVAPPLAVWAYWWRRGVRRLPDLPAPSGFVELVQYDGPTLTMTPSFSGLPRTVRSGDVLLVDQDLAADLVELRSRHWRYV
jgi:hypothetical protein